MKECKLSGLTRQDEDLLNHIYTQDFRDKVMVLLGDIITLEELEEMENGIQDYGVLC